MLDRHRQQSLRRHGVLACAGITVLSLSVRKSLTGVSQLHPGGKQIILKYAGKDATAVYKPIHSEDALEKNLSKEKHLGPVDSDAAREIQEVDANRKKTKDELRMEQAKLNKPPLKRILTLQDMEVRLGNYSSPQHR